MFLLYIKKQTGCIFMYYSKDECFLPLSFSFSFIYHIQNRTVTWYETGNCKSEKICSVYNTILYIMAPSVPNTLSVLRINKSN